MPDGRHGKVGNAAVIGYLSDQFRSTIQVGKPGAAHSFEVVDPRGYARQHFLPHDIQRLRVATDAWMYKALRRDVSRTSTTFFVRMEESLSGADAANEKSAQIENSGYSDSELLHSFPPFRET